MPDRRTGARCASWSSARSAGRQSVPRAGAPRCSGWPRTSRNCADLFDEPRGPEPRRDGEAAAPAGAGARLAAAPSCRRSSAQEEWPALLERAPLDLRVNVAQTAREEVLQQLPDASPTPLVRGASPAGRHQGRRPARLHVRPDRGAGRRQPADRARLRRERRRDASSTCARAPAASRWRCAAAAPTRAILATDTDRGRLSQLPPRAERAGARSSRPACSTRRTSAELGRLARARPISCWSTRPARERDLAAQSRRPLAADARAARARRRRSRRGCSTSPPSWCSPGGRARLCGLLACFPRRGRAGRALPRPPFIVD